MNVTFLDTAKGVPVMVTAHVNFGDVAHPDCPEEPGEIEYYDVNPAQEWTDEDEARWEEVVWRLVGEARDEALDHRLEERDYWRGR